MLTKLRDSAFAKDTAVLSLGTIGAQVVAIAAIPVLSRIYSPVEFGVLAVFIAVSSIVATAVTLRYETAVLLPKNNAESDNVVKLTLTLAILLGVSFSISATLLPDKVKSLIGVRELGNWLPVAVLAGLAGAVIATGSAWLTRRRAYVKLAQLRLVQSSIAVLAGVGLGYSGAGHGLILAQFIASVTVCVSIAIQVLPMLERWSHRSMLEVGRTYQAAPRFLLPTALLDVVSMQLPLLLISAWFSSEASGQFSMAWRIAALPITLVGSAIGQVFFQRFAQAWPDVMASRQLLYKAWSALGLIGLLPAILLTTYGEPIFAWFLGDAWGEAGVIAGVIAPMLLLMLISSPTSSAFVVLGLQRYTLFFGIAVLIYRPLSLWVGLMFGSLFVGLYIMVVFEIIQILVYQYLIWRKLNTA